MPKKRVLTIKEAAELIDGLTEFRVRQMCISGQFPCFMTGERQLIYEENLYRVVLGADDPKSYDEKIDKITDQVLTFYRFNAIIKR